MSEEKLQQCKKEQVAEEKETYASEVWGSLGFRALRVGALPVGLEAVLSPDFFRLLEG